MLLGKMLAKEAAAARAARRRARRNLHAAQSSERITTQICRQMDLCRKSLKRVRKGGRKEKAETKAMGEGMTGGDTGNHSARSQPPSAHSSAHSVSAPAKTLSIACTLAALAARRATINTTQIRLAVRKTMLDGCRSRKPPNTNHHDRARIQDRQDNFLVRSVPSPWFTSKAVILVSVAASARRADRQPTAVHGAGIDKKIRI
ncbi:MAG: hypothetical protein KatS3mg105_1166 [Gemmatales bacterium]|nr:MAG: hypothetical protein KatS3mg105_1166 [Gemmatales bacterium]